MNLCIFFEGTGQGVAGRITNVTRLRDACVVDARQKLHLEAVPGTRFGAYLSGKTPGPGAGESSDGIASSEAALNGALSEAGIDVNVGKPDAVPEAAGEVPPGLPSGTEPISGTSSEDSGEKDVSELIDMIRSWLKSVSD